MPDDDLITEDEYFEDTYECGCCTCCGCSCYEFLDERDDEENED